MLLVAGPVLNTQKPTPETAHYFIRSRSLPTETTGEPIFHSDRGSNYTSDEYAKVLESLGILQSVGRTGICFDNAMAESFFGVLKVERVHRTQYPTRAHARRDIARYIEFRYNSRRIHSGLGYCTPQEVHDAYIDRKAAA